MVRVAATYAILKYWCEEPMVSGGTESAMEQAQEWWESRRSTER